MTKKLVNIKKDDMRQSFRKYKYYEILELISNKNEILDENQLEKSSSKNSNEKLKKIHPMLNWLQY